MDGGLSAAKIRDSNFLVACPIPVFPPLLQHPSDPQKHSDINSSRCREGADRHQDIGMI